MSVYSDARSAVRLGTIEALTQSGWLSTPVIYSHQNGAEPAESYVVVQIVSLDQIGHSQVSTLTDEGTPTEKNLIYKSQYEMMVQFTFAGSEAPDMATEFLNAIPNNVVVREAYQTNNLTPVRKSTLRRAPQKRDTEWIEFFNVDVTFSYMLYTTQTIDWVETVIVVDTNTGEVITIPEPTP